MATESMIDRTRFAIIFPPLIEACNFPYRINCSVNAANIRKYSTDFVAVSLRITLDGV